MEIENQSASNSHERGSNSGFSTAAYELLDFGDGRKLERFGGRVLDRPCPAAKGSGRKRLSEWSAAERVYRDPPGLGWEPPESLPGWLFRWRSIAMELRLSPFGHVGLFPEQIANWRWLQALVRLPSPTAAFRALNLFGYTGGSSLALAAEGCRVTHVDASRPTVVWARHNAAHSGLESASIRWIVDDVRDFVRREAKRGERYDMVVMDPPAYGHGTDGQGWSLARDLDSLVEDCLGLLRPKSTAFLLTGHSPIPSLEQGPLSERVWHRLGSAFDQASQHRVSLFDASRRKLDFGYAYRFWNSRP